MSKNLSLNCGGHLVSLEKPLVMGVLNVTPDSFYDGGRYTGEEQVLEQTRRMLTEGASFIDVGGMSSRPGAEIISVEEELQRVIPVIKLVKKEFPEALISIDTIRGEVAREAAAAGAVMINDISAGKFDPEMFPAVAELGLPYVLMHMQGKPSDMQKSPQYENVTLEVLDFFIHQVGALRELGVKDIVLDPGFGFGKTVGHNYQLLRELEVFKMLDCPVLAGVSRKSMICKVLGVKPAEALNGTTAVNTLALLKGAHILRVHDVKEAREAIKIVEAFGESEK